MTKPAALLASLFVAAACSSDPRREPQTPGNDEVESAPAEPSAALPASQTPTPTSPDTTAAAMTSPAEANTTAPAATLEEAAPPPEP